MAIHRPKHLSTASGLGLPNTTKQFVSKTQDHGTLAEVWNDMPKGAWHQDEITIAEPGYTWISDWQVGQPYVVIQFFGKDMQLVGTYIEITTPVRRIEDDFECLDMYLDVWQPSSGKAVLLDEDELQEAVKAGYVTDTEAAGARAAAGQIMGRLTA